jgi:hypothetical protein
MQSAAMDEEKELHASASAVLNHAGRNPLLGTAVREELHAVASRICESPLGKEIHSYVDRLHVWRTRNQHGLNWKTLQALKMDGWRIEIAVMYAQQFGNSGPGDIYRITRT